jgi:hypothetical protein
MGLTFLLFLNLPLNSKKLTLDSSKETKEHGRLTLGCDPVKKLQLASDMSQLLSCRSDFLKLVYRTNAGTRAGTFLHGRDTLGFGRSYQTTLVDGFIQLPWTGSWWQFLTDFF